MVQARISGKVRRKLTPVLCLLRLPGNRDGFILADMSTVHEIETAVSKLSRQELLAFRDWFSEFDAAAWDKQFEEDVAAGHLDALADEAIRDLREGRCRDL